MPAEPKIRGEVHIALTRLVQVGVVAAYKASLSTNNELGAPFVTVTVPEGRSPDEVKLRVMDAIANVAIGIDVRVEAS